VEKVNLPDRIVLLVGGNNRKQESILTKMKLPILLVNSDDRESDLKCMGADGERRGRVGRDFACEFSPSFPRRRMRSATEGWVSQISKGGKFPVQWDVGTGAPTVEDLRLSLSFM